MEADPAETDAELNRPPSSRLNRLRSRIARAILLPELSGREAYELRHKIMDEGALSQGYVLMCALSAGIATLGLLQSSTAVVIGAMLVSPLMSPIAALGFGFASIDGRRIRDAARVVLVGAVIGIVTGMLVTWLSPIRNATPEILARTEPTLLDLGVALLSGIAGGYATVRGKGETAIGVAIATALMPPLATIGYGLGVFQPAFALGALLLFLTNLSAIAFAFALMARLSGAARPFGNVEWRPAYAIAGMAAFLVLATPLAITLIRVTHEAGLRAASRQGIAAAIGEKNVSIAQLDVNWPSFGSPQVAAVVITPRYVVNAEERLRTELTAAEGEVVDVSVQQILAADVSGQTRAMIDAALERTVAGISADVPPFARVRASIGLPTRGIWTNRAERILYMEPVAADGWRLADYYEIEQRAGKVAGGWTVRVLPPAQPELRVAVADGPVPDDTVPLELAIWALQRWGMTSVAVVMPEGSADQSLSTAMKKAGISIHSQDARSGQDGIAIVEVFGQPPVTQTQPALDSKPRP